MIMHAIQECVGKAALRIHLVELSKEESEFSRAL